MSGAQPTTGARTAGAKTAKARPARIIAVGGGKGGIGKSVVSVTLGIELANRGLAVTLVDCDLGGPNLHSLLAMPFPRTTLSDFVLRRVPTLGELAVETPVPRLSLISSARNAVSVATPMHKQKLRLIRAIRSLAADVVLLDLGAGSHPAVVDFFLLAHSGVILVAPEPTSVENAYRFLKAAFLRALREADDGERLKPLLLEASQQRDGRAASPAEIIARVGALDPEVGERVRAHLARFRPWLLVNQTRDASEEALAEGMCAATSRLFGIEVGCLGHLRYSMLIERAVRARLPLVHEHLGREMVAELAAVATRLLDGPASAETRA